MDNIKKDIIQPEIILPSCYIIETSRLCNFSCLMCPYRFYKPNETGLMSFELFNKIIEKISEYAKIIQLYWMGEPLLNPFIIQFIKIAKRKTSARIIVSTNGSLLTARLIDQLLESGLDRMIIDVDANSEKMYSSIRVGGSFKRLEENLDYFFAHNKQVEVDLQFLDFKMNHKEMVPFIERWKNEKCKIRVEWIDTWANQMPEMLEYAHSISPYVAEERKPCSDLWKRMVINYKGGVNLCCHDYKGKYLLGSVNDEGICAIWNSENILEIRKKQIEGIYSGLCKECVEWAKPSEYEEFL